MLLLVVWLVVGVLAVLVLGGVAYGVLGAAARLRREVEAVDRDLRPVLEDVQRTAARAAERQAADS